METSDPLDKAAHYARDVINGKILTGDLTKLAVHRNDNDLKQAAHRGFFFDEEKAYQALKLFDYLKHSKGEMAGNIITLEPWQCWNIACVFGWVYEDTGLRRFRTAYEEIARKNGKTTKLAGIGIKGLTKDGEGGPEIYSAATKSDQAKLLFEEASRMIRQSKALRKRLVVHNHHIAYPDNFGKFMPLASDGKTMDGLNPHMALIDELHAHKTSEVWDVLKSALGSRSQPLIWAITTAGFNKNGICYEIRDYAIKVLQGIIDDDAFFAIIYTLDEGDDYFDDKNWIKANPNLGVSVKLDYLHEQARQAAVMPTAMVNFLTKHLNIWTTGISLWCNIEKWKQCAAEYEQNHLWTDLQVRKEIKEVYIGLDLAQISDIASATGIAVFNDGTWRVFGRHYLPEDTVENIYRKSMVPLMDWHKKGFLTLTPGAVTDYNWIKADLLSWMELLPVKEIAFDRYNSSQLVNDLMEANAPMVGFGQGYVSMNPAMKELERRYLSGLIQHSNDPVLNWAMSNVVAEQDPAGNIKPAKNKSSEKIDPAVALVMAVGRAMLANLDTSPTPELIIL